MESKFQFQKQWDIVIPICLRMHHDNFHATIAILNTASDIARHRKFKIATCSHFAAKLPTLVLGHDVHLAQWLKPSVGEVTYVIGAKVESFHPLWHISTLGSPVRKEMIIPMSGVVSKWAIPF